MEKAILFDVDGTLLDTQEFIYRAFEYTMQMYNHPRISRAVMAGAMGKPLEECYGLFCPDLNAEEMSDMHRQFQEKNLNLAVLFPGVLETLQELKNKGFKLGVITTRSKRTSVETLKQTGIDGFFDVIISGEDTVNKKPHPEPLLKALETLNVSPEYTYMVGDTEADMLAGKNAGVKTVGVTYGFIGTKIQEFQPNVVIHSFPEVLHFVQ